MDLQELIHKYYRTLRAARLLRYMLQAEHRVTEEREQQTWSLVRQAEFQEFQPWTMNLPCSRTQGGHKLPHLVPFVTNMLVWGGGAKRPERETSPSSHGVLPGVVPCRRWC